MNKQSVLLKIPVFNDRAHCSQVLWIRMEPLNQHPKPGFLINPDTSMHLDQDLRYYDQKLEKCKDATSSTYIFLDYD